jgi:hypothetical protein
MCLGIRRKKRRRVLKKILCRRCVPFLVNLEHELTKEYNEVIAQEVLQERWLQKSGNTWLKEGYEVEGLNDDEGNWKTDKSDSRATALSYLKGLFSKKWTVGVFIPILNLFPRVDAEELEGLNADVTPLSEVSFPLAV